MKFRLKILPVLCLIILLSLNEKALGQFTFHQGTAQTINQGTKTVRLLGEVNTEVLLSKYGGTLDKQLTGTGYFTIRKIDNIWYLLDPDGYYFLTIGVNSVSKGGGITLPDALRNIGTNTLGCWSDETINSATTQKIAYTPRWNFMQTYKNGSQRTKDLFNKGIIPVFDPAYPSFCDSHAKQLSVSKNDPYLLGHFSDNELPIYDNSTYGDLLDRFLAIENKSDPNYLAANNWMVLRKGNGYTIDETDRENFHGFLCGKYYQITAEAIKRYDPNHLYLGSRLHGGALSKPSIYIEAAKYVDMISINCYNVWTPTKTMMDMWSAGNKPFFITEFYAKAEDSGLTNESGAGWLVKTQDDRAKFFENFVLALIEHPGCVGFHHFRYMDDVDSNKGLISATYQWYEPLKSSFYKIARDIYKLKSFMMDKSTGINIPLKNKSIQIFPNPSLGLIQIKSENNRDLLNIEVYSSSGTMLQNLKNLENPVVVHLQNYPAGHYLVKVFQDSNYNTMQIIKTN